MILKPHTKGNPFMFVVSIKPRAEDLRQIRDLIAFAFEEWGLDKTVPVLLANELATNALTHTPETENIIVRTYIGERGLPVIETWDDSSIMPLPKDPHLFDVDGRGLLLIDKLSARWGVRPAAEGGKVIWLEVVPEPA